MSEGPRKIWRPDYLHLGSELECYITKAKTKNRNVGHDEKRICSNFLIKINMMVAELCRSGLGRFTAFKEKPPAFKYKSV